MTPKLREPLTVFVDRSLGGKRLVRALCDAGIPVVAHDTVFPQDAPDQDWLRYAGKEGLLVLTGDMQHRHESIELQAIVERHVAVFQVKKRGDRRAEDIAEAFVRAWSRVQAVARATTRPFVASVTFSGEVAVRYPRPAR